MCKARGIRNFHVKRNKFEFAKLPDVKRPKRGVVAGTQCIDRMWASLDKFIPPELSNKSGKGGTVNEKIFTSLYAWALALPLAKKRKLQSGTGQNLLTKFVASRAKKEAANSTCRSTIAVKSTKHKLSLKNPREFTNAWPCFRHLTQIQVQWWYDGFRGQAWAYNLNGIVLRLCHQWCSDLPVYSVCVYK